MVLISEIIKKFVGLKECIHFQYDAISETALRWVDKKRTRYKPARATILLPEMLCPDENLVSLKKYEIMMIAIPKDKLYEAFPDLCPSGDLIADKQNSPDVAHSCDSESNRRSMNKNRKFKSATDLAN